MKSPSYKNDYEEGSETSNLKQCEGDCDRDSDCGPGLRCFQRNGYTVSSIFVFIQMINVIFGADFQSSTGKNST